MTPEEAVHEWARRQLPSHHSSAKVVRVTFDINDHGYCETCSNPYLGLYIQYEWNGKTHHYEYDPGEMVMEDIFAQVTKIREGE